jgi:site-specific recombinase XerD
VPKVIADQGDHAARRFLEFLAATIRNKNTRLAYYRAAVRFFAWVDQHQLGEFADIEPLHIAAYVEAMTRETFFGGKNISHAHQENVDMRQNPADSPQARAPFYCAR